MRLQGALDNDILVATQRFLSDGIAADTTALYVAIQRSNSSLKRKPKKVLTGSIDRVLEFLEAERGSGYDSEKLIEDRVSKAAPEVDVMNRSLRANLASTPTTAPPSPPATGDDANAARKRKATGESLPKRQKTERISVAPPSDISLRDLGGMDDVVLRLEALLALPLKCPQKFAGTRLGRPKGVLLHGPPGCGKTMVSKAYAAALGLPFIEIMGPSIVSGMSGESEKAIRERFEEAKKVAPSIIFMDEIDAIAPKRESSQSQMEKRIVAQLLVSMDELNSDATKPVMVLAATNRPDSIDPALRRGGRFGTEININVPNEKVRASILKALTRTVPVAREVDFKQLAKMTAGFVGADLQDLIEHAFSWQNEKYLNALKAQAQEYDLNDEMAVDGTETSEIIEASIKLIARLDRNDVPEPPGFEDDTISMEAFLAVLPSITPSSKREGFATVPDVSWADVGALTAVREQLEDAIVLPIRDPELYSDIGLTTPAGVLLWGPPGCGKTLLAKAVAAESKANFISIKGPELLNKYVGESEAAVRRVFMRARSSVPCVIFFDELDALTPKRDDAVSEASARVVNTLLTELDGLSARAGIYVIAATNRPDIIDDAMMRPGRLETPLFVPLPDANARVEILRALLRSKPIDKPETVVEIAKTCTGFSGADLEALLRKAQTHAVKRGVRRVAMQDFEYAAKEVQPSVTRPEKYERMKDTFRKH